MSRKVSAASQTTTSTTGSQNARPRPEHFVARRTIAALLLAVFLLILAQLGTLPGNDADKEQNQSIDSSTAYKSIA